MPYGNKGLHFGHVGGVFVPADAFARFLRDRIGPQNVLFVCGTDCFGSPINEGYRKLQAEQGFAGSIADYVRQNHDVQVATLKSYDISLDIYEGSGLGKSAAVHQQLNDAIIQRLYDNGYLHRVETAQFYDERAESFLNGRQVIGHCPVPGCKSEHGYADECDLGHQYMPADLIAPKSALTGDTPTMRKVMNWYFDLPSFRSLLQDYVAQLRTDGSVRPVVANTIEEFLQPPIIYVKSEFEQDYLRVVSKLPLHDYRPTEKGKASFELEFADLAARDAARLVLDGISARYRTGKALVPFRLTGNIEWGLKAPAIEGVDGLTVWCWPESLWAPVSFTKTYLENHGQGLESLNPGRAAAAATDGLDEVGAADVGDTAAADGTGAGGSGADGSMAAAADGSEAALSAGGSATAPGWEDFWCSPDATAYQFIGQDNIYFYGVAQTAIWSALPRGGHPELLPGAGQLQQTKLIANYHLLFLDKKASSSSEVRPPMADELLGYYTPEQLRAHFLSLGLGLKPVSFQPKPLNPQAKETDADPVLKEGTLLTNVFNRLARSCFYGAQKDCGGLMPLGNVDGVRRDEAHATILEYERLMHRQEFHAVMQLVSNYIRQANKLWSDAIKQAGEDIDSRRAVLVDAFYMLRVCCLLMHPIAPAGTRMIYEYLNLDASEEQFFSWEQAFSGFEAFVNDADTEQGGHPINELPPRTDFFERHPSQYQEKWQ
jgi:methionyl-tRNA synthetase